MVTALLSSWDDYASPPSCLTPETAVGSSIRYFAKASSTLDRSIWPASASAWSVYTTTDSASMWKNRRAAGRVSAKPKPSAPSTR